MFIFADKGTEKCLVIKIISIKLRVQRDHDIAWGSSSPESATENKGWKRRRETRGAGRILLFSSTVVIALFNGFKPRLSRATLFAST